MEQWEIYFYNGDKLMGTLKISGTYTFALEEAESIIEKYKFNRFVIVGA